MRGRVLLVTSVAVNLAFLSVALYMLIDGFVKDAAGDGPVVFI